MNLTSVTPLIKELVVNTVFSLCRYGGTAENKKVMVRLPCVSEEILFDNVILACHAQTIIVMINNLKISHTDTQEEGNIVLLNDANRDMNDAVWTEKSESVYQLLALGMGIQHLRPIMALEQYPSAPDKFGFYISHQTC